MSYTPLTTYQRSLIAYSIGFVGSLVLTLLSYTLVTQQLLSGWTIVIVIASLAVIQCIVQIVFFLHLGQEERPRWRLMTMFAMLAIFCIVVFGSIWVMHDLNSRMMPTEQEMKEYMIKQAGF